MDMTKKIFEDNLQDSDKSLHGIIYCIKNGSDANRILDGEINFIKELNKIYGNSDILTIAFTQSLNQDDDKIKERMNELREKINNKKIEIIPVNSKKEKINIINQKITIPQFGLNELKNTMINNSKNIINANLKYAAKVQIKDYFFSKIKEKFITMINQFKKQEFENIFSKGCEKIIRSLLMLETTEKLDINFNFKSFDKLILELIEKLKIKIIKNLKKQYTNKCLEKMNDRFIILNAKYNNPLKWEQWLEQYFINIKLKEYFEKRINDEVYKITFEKAYIFFLKISKKFIGENICNNVTDEEIRDLVNKNTHNILKKILKK